MMSRGMTSHHNASRTRARRLHSLLCLTQPRHASPLLVPLADHKQPSDQHLLLHFSSRAPNYRDARPWTKPSPALERLTVAEIGAHWRHSERGLSLDYGVWCVTVSLSLLLR